MKSSAVLTLAFVALFAGAGMAQCPALHPTVGLTINGIDPTTDPANSVSLTAPFSMALDVSDSGGASMPLALLVGSGIQCGSITAPGVASLSVDMTGVSVLIDGTGGGLGISALQGLGVTPLNISVAFPTSTWGGLNGPAFQAVVFDPTLGPVPYGTTGAGQLTFSLATVTSYTLPDDGSVAHALGGSGILFGGVARNTVYLCSNGFVTFNAGSGDFTQTLVEHFNGWGFSPNPGVSLMYTDLNNGATASGATYDVAEDLLTGDVSCNFNNQNYWGPNEAAGSFSATFAGPQVTLDYTALIGQVTGAQNFIIGVTDGDQSVGTDTDMSVINGGVGILNNLGLYVSPGNDDSIAEEYLPADAALLQAAGFINFLDLGNFQYLIL